MHATIFKSSVVNSNISLEKMSVNQQTLDRKKLNTKQAHTAPTKGKEEKGMTLVQIDGKTEFSLNNALTERFCRLQKDYDWILNRKDSLTTSYPNKYIAVQNQVVRFSADSVEALIREITTRNEQVENFAVEFMNTFPRNFLF